MEGLDLTEENFEDDPQPLGEYVNLSTIDMGYHHNKVSQNISE